jgi:putative glutamine amidotransferase
MTNAPLIGIPTFHDKTSPEAMPERFAMSRPYIHALELSGALPVLLPLALGLTTLRRLYSRLDGLFMAGGGDLSPTCYNRPRYDKTDGIDGLRDETEMILIRWALEDAKPILGVCRGSQGLNVAAGGTLIQDVSDYIPNALRHQYFPEKPRNYVAHDVTTVPDTQLAHILGQAGRVNSFHHQAVEQIAPGFVAAAHAPDGVIEAVEYTGAQFAIGVQWHPEGLVEADPSMLALFKKFVDATTAA